MIHRNRHHPRSSIPGFLLLLTVLVAPAGEEPIPDPWQSLHPYRAIACLAALRQPLDAQPDDQRLLGLALMSYVNLCLEGENETTGGSGPWLAYAQTLAARRAKARGGAQPATLAEAAPELWVQAITGDLVAVSEALKHWPDEQKSPHHRALAALATRDWHAFHAQEPATVHERYVAVHVGFESGARQFVDALDLGSHEHNPLVSAIMQWRSNRWGNPATVVKEAVAATAWILRGRELDDAQALALLGQLITACGGQPEQGVTRDQALRAAATAAERIERTSGRAIGVAYRICNELSARPRGLLGADGKHRLVGLGDLAAWNRDRLYLAGFYGYLLNRDGRDGSFAGADQAFVAPLREAAPGSVLATRYALGLQGVSFAENDKPTPEVLTAAATALKEELSRDPCHGDLTLIIAINKLAKQRPDLAAQSLRALLAKRSAGLGRAGLERAVDLAADCGLVPLVLPSLRHWAARDPHDLGLHKLMLRWSAAGSLLSLDGLKPTRSWIDPQVNNTKLPWPELGASERFAIRWSGSLRITTPGSYVVAVDSDDGSRLVVGDLVVDNAGDHAMQVRQTRGDLPAGWVPLRLEFHQGGGEAGCRLLWQPPGATQLELIPAAALAHGDERQPGLAADGYALDVRYDQIFGQDLGLIAFARARPWHLGAQELVGTALYDANRAPEATPFFRASVAELDDMRFSGMRLTLCLLGTPDVEGALANLRRFPDLGPRGWEYGFSVWALRKAGRLDDAIAILGDHLEADVVGNFVRGNAALDRMDIPAARKYFRAYLDGWRNASVRWMDLNQVRLHLAILDRIDGKEPNWNALREDIHQSRGEPYHDLVIDFLSGAETWDACKARIPTTPDGEDLFYFRAWVDLTTGQHAAAKAAFADLLARHPTWYEAPTCRAVLAWYARQTPETLAKLPVAKPVSAAPPAPDAKNKGKAGAEDF